jgi:aminocarboxymuconate-semialdehyde decarboxylase
VIGNPLDSTVAVSHLIFGGMPDRLPHYPSRMNHAWRARPDASTVIKKPSSYLKKFYFESISFDTQVIDSLIERYGPRQVRLGLRDSLKRSRRARAETSTESWIKLVELRRRS